MKQFLLILGALILIAIALVVFGRRGHVASTNLHTENIRTNDGPLYVIEYFEQRIVVLLPKSCDNITSRTSQNSRAQSLDVDIDFFGKNGQPSVNIQFHSYDRGTLLIDEQPFDLNRGAVFLVKEGASPRSKKGLVQAPFNPLKVSPEYATKLREELDK